MAAGLPRRNGGQGVPRSARKAVRRLACALLAALILAQASVSRPAQAGAFLPAITGAAVVSAWLMACGVYPYISEDGQTFGEWGAGQLRDLWNSYIDSFADGQTPSGGTKETFDKISGFVTGKTIAIAKGLWSELRSFANWIVSEFSITDNSYGDSLIIGKMTFQTNIGPILYTEFDVPLGGLAVNKADVNWTSAFETLSLIFRTVNNSSDNGYVLGTEGSYVSLPFPSGATYNVTNGSVFVINGAYHKANYTRFSPCVLAFGLYDGNLFIASVAENDTKETFTFNTSYSWPISNIQTAKSGDLTVDTKTVSVPAELPETATYGGLTVPDAISGTAPAITDVIEQGVTDRTQPVVRPTVVTLEDVTVDDETGEITDDTPVAITPDDIPYNSGQFQIPSLETTFPFSIPWDIMRIYGALNAEPQRPEFHFTLTFPIVGEFQLDVAIPEEVAPQVDAFAAFFRNLILVLLCVWLLYQSKDWVQFS